jgi:hypothetical protein
VEVLAEVAQTEVLQDLVLVAVLEVVEVQLLHLQQGIQVVQVLLTE